MTASTTKTEVGSYFVSNYPPYSQWNPAQLAEIERAMHAPPTAVPLGLYLHIPFCRKRCKFCYFRVYTDKNASQIETYVQALAREVELVSHLPSVGGRDIRFVYFGGGTPSYLSVRQLQSLFERLHANMRWERAEEVTFECEPGTLSEPKLAALRELGVTRLSLGVENFSDRVLEENGRAHLSTEIYKAWESIQRLQFPNVNIDLISGMVGETWQNWQECVERALEMQPDSITIYQMELPYNTIYSHDLLQSHQETPVADWNTKRAWVSHAFDRFQAAGYAISSGYTLVRDPNKINFSYRDNLWQGSDLLATGVASFGHLSGVHYQNDPEWEGYVRPLLQQGRLPLYRALRPTEHQRLIREMILQLKRGYLAVDYFQRKFGLDILAHWQPIWDEYVREGLVELKPDRIELTRAGLLTVDGLLPAFFEPEHQGVRYT